ncbi:GNAT family N-acetyltransferase [Zobellella endophytica]|uniref:GNAT family N-acetyltransferase n=1 Tax=Zobellella endophytica TaxID=2116700 RepID=A0A2P7RBQ7_9GAMM|nr:GNAT family N-acetyltransferase [Zobellella endophytica]PSJ47639.1 GNAT family N-acetyltransferase [Zobellella endophytica]
MNITIRHCDPSDNADLFEIYRHTSVTENSSQLPYLGREQVAGLFHQASHYTLVAETEDRVVGHVTLFLSQKPRDRHGAMLAIAVHPDMQGQGVGKRLMRAAIEQADHWLNLVRLELEVQADNAPAQALYRSLGFEQEGVKRLATFKAGRYHDLVLMARIRPELA